MLPLLGKKIRSVCGPAGVRREHAAEDEPASRGKQELRRLQT